MERNQAPTAGWELDKGRPGYSAVEQLDRNRKVPATRQVISFSRTGTPAPAVDWELDPGRPGHSAVDQLEWGRSQAPTADWELD